MKKIPWHQEKKINLDSQKERQKERKTRLADRAHSDSVENILSRQRWS